MAARIIQSLALSGGAESLAGRAAGDEVEPSMLIVSPQREVAHVLDVLMIAGHFVGEALVFVAPGAAPAEGRPRQSGAMHAVADAAVCERHRGISFFA